MKWETGRVKEGWEGGREEGDDDDGGGGLIWDGKRGSCPSKRGFPSGHGAGCVNNLNWDWDGELLLRETFPCIYCSQE